MGKTPNNLNWKIQLLSAKKHHAQNKEPPTVVSETDLQLRSSPKQVAMLTPPPLAGLSIGGACPREGAGVSFSIVQESRSRHVCLETTNVEYRFSPAW